MHYKNHFSNVLDLLDHRGPDAKGVKCFDEERVILGHTRLSIIDISNLSNQPLSDISGNISITYNGEIYNYLELKKELLGIEKQFVTESDTEVIIQLYKVYGESAFKMLDGQFAFCISDQNTNTCYLVRDRCGEKPLLLPAKAMLILVLLA